MGKDNIHQPDGSIHLDSSGNIIPPERLSEHEIDIALIRVMEMQIDEQIRSNKVIEGILKDIHNSIDRLSDRELLD